VRLLLGLCGARLMSFLKAVSTLPFELFLVVRVGGPGLHRILRGGAQRHPGVAEVQVTKEALCPYCGVAVLGWLRSRLAQHVQAFVGGFEPTDTYRGPGLVCFVKLQDKDT